ncbi:tetratricopeptide repeat protein [Lactococcus lactis]|jgi:TPR repeat protein|uniref:Sel1 repeat family protein n=1 Tax=Lactococcus lactis TaxID=1358 RepID=A0A6B3S125_9LACT|nr:tetratricopeptide repeat protein [Lactococcus lactis]MCI2095460.1 sel1 repeat family protein [Lactococcus lactis]MCI2138755.1 sel1 repeat family protein [Lactococcus lactis]MCT1173375.1 sel1 repeat family protein [Lactococcus lactis]MCT1184813.1 sel1 repeat family protein [Lactococcus lactis]MCT1188731.1 sel1 repeat family protein [Lactococcus lactis]
MQNLKDKHQKNKKRKWLFALVVIIFLVTVGLILLLTQSTRISAELGQAKAQYSIGLNYYQKKNYVKARTWLVKASNQKNADAENTLAVMYLNGLGVRKDALKAEGLFQDSAKKGNKYAQEHLGTLYYFGQGVVKDYTIAEKWLKKSSDAGMENSQNLLGTMFLYGQGVEKNKQMAIELYRKSAAQGNKYAQANLKKLGISA